MQPSFQERRNQLIGGGENLTPTPFVQSTSGGNSFQERRNKLLFTEQPQAEKKSGFKEKAGSLFKQISDTVASKLSGIKIQPLFEKVKPYVTYNPLTEVPGGFKGGVQRLKEGIPQLPKKFVSDFAPAIQYVEDTAKAVGEIEGIGKLTPAYMVYRAAIGKPIKPKEYASTLLKNGVGILNVAWRANLAAPLIGTGLNSWKGVRQYLQGKISAGELLETPLKGINNQPGFGEVFTDNVKLAEAIDIVFLATMFVEPFARKKLGSLNLKAEEISKVSKVLDVKPNATLREISEAFRRKIKELPDTFTSNPKPENLIKRKELQTAYDILSNAGVIDKKYAAAYDFIQSKLGKVGVEVKAPAVPEKPKSLLSGIESEITTKKEQPDRKQPDIFTAKEKEKLLERKPKPEVPEAKKVTELLPTQPKGVGIKYVPVSKINWELEDINRKQGKEWESFKKSVVSQYKEGKLEPIIVREIEGLDGKITYDVLDGRNRAEALFDANIKEFPINVSKTIDYTQPKGVGGLIDEATALKSAKQGTGKFLPGEVYEQELGGLGVKQVLIQGKDAQGNILGWYLPDKKSAQMLGQTEGFLQPAKFKPDPTTDINPLRPSTTPTEKIRQAIDFMFGKKPKGVGGDAKIIKTTPPLSPTGVVSPIQVQEGDPLVADLEKIPSDRLTSKDIGDIAEIESKSKVEFDLPKKQKELVNKEKQLTKQEEKQKTELLDTIKDAIFTGDIEVARVLHEDALIGNPDLPSFDNLIGEMESYQEQTLNEVSKDLKAEVSGGEIDDPTNKILKIADKLSAHFKGPGALYKIVGKERQYKTPEGILTVGGDAKKAFDDLIFSTDIEGFGKNIRLLSLKFDKIFTSISENIKAGDIDGADYESFKKSFKEQIEKRATFSAKRGTPVSVGATKAKAEVAKGGGEAPVTPSTEKISVPTGTASTGTGKIGEFENIPAELTEASNFKLFEKTRALTDKYIKMIGKGTLGEKYTPRRALGVFYSDTYNVRVNGMNDLGVTAHEDSHLLDAAYNISDRLLEVKGWAKNGNPIYSPETKGLRKEITNLYTEYYPGGKTTHKLKKRAVEGFATLMEKYTEIPTTITSKYPNLVKEFLKEDGKYYKPVIGEMLKDLREIVTEYQGLDPLDKIGARVTKNALEPKKQFLNLAEKVRTFVEDEIYPVEKVARVAGVHFTKDDPSLWLRAMQTGGGVYANNVLTKRGYWAFRNGDFVKVHDFNWKTLIDHLNKEKTHDSFGYYLVARREHYAYEELAEYKAKVDKAKQVVKDLGKEAGEVADENGNTPLDNLRQAQEEYSKLKKVLDNDGFTEEEVSEAYLANAERFKKEEEVFDVLVSEDLKMLHDPEVQLVNNETFQKLTDKKGYATFKRRFEDELVGEEGYGAMTVKGGVKASFLKSRAGSARAIINPVASSVRNHIEAVKKSMRQIVYNKIGKIAEEAVVPDMFQKLQLQITADAKNRIYYPQEKDPNIIMARIDYKRVPILTHSLIKSTIDNVLTFQSMNIFEQVLVSASRMFTVGTTGMYPAFAATNFAADQWNAIVNSRNKYTPLVDSLRILKEGMTGQKGEVGRIYEMYEVLGGSRLTLANFLSLPADQAVKAVINERNGIQKSLDLINKGINVFSIPSNTSETVTRFAEFYKAIKAGKSQVVALEEAARITGPFHHIGSWRVKGISGKNMIKAMPFANASLQIMTQLIRTGQDSTEGRKRIAFAMAALVGLYLSSIAAVSQFGSDDQKEQYKDLKTNEIGMFLYFPFTNGKGLVRVKVSPELSVIATMMALKINEQVFGVKYKLAEYADALFNILPQQMQINDPAAMFLSWFNPLVKVPFELIANIKDYPSVRPIEGAGMQYKAPGERYNESTSTLAKVLGKKLNISPLKIDFLVTGIFGRYTGFFTGKPGIYSVQNAYLRDYYFTTGRRVENFYDEYNKAQAQYKQIDTLPREQRAAVAKKYGQVKNINDLLKVYRDIDLQKDPLKAQKLRNMIIKEIDKLSGEGKQSSIKMRDSLASLVKGAGNIISKLTPTVNAMEGGKKVLGIEVKGDDVITRYEDSEGVYKESHKNIDSDLSILQSVGKVLGDIGTKLGLPELNVSEKLGYRSKEERINELLSYNDQINATVEKPKKTGPGFTEPMQQPKGVLEAKPEDIKKVIPKEYEDLINEEFGDQAENAKRVLRYTNEKGEVHGENPGYRAGREVDVSNEGYQKGVNSKQSPGDVLGKDGLWYSQDRGLYRINSRNFTDREFKRYKKRLKAAGITIESPEEAWDEMLDPEKNIKMAKIIYDEGGWGRWFAAPPDLLAKR